MNIGIFGLGYVGVVNVACFSKLGYKVYCTDVKPNKVQLIKEGKSPIVEPEINELLEEGINLGNIIACQGAEEVVKNSQLLIFCVGTPSKPDGEVNLSFLNNVVSEVAGFLDKNDQKYFAFRSTVPPGTTEAICDRYLAEFPGITPVFFPEFLREGTAVKDFFLYGRCVVGTKKGKDISELTSVLHVCKSAPLFNTDLRTAEYSKYIDNSFHALKVVFANEVFGLANDLGVNVKDSHQIFIADDRLNISTRYFRPGMPFGGSCLPKDVREIQHLLKRSEKEYSLIKSLIPSNEQFINRLYNLLKSASNKKIAFVGLTFKNHSDDLRESPVLKLLDRLIAEGESNIKIWDEDFNMESIRIDYPHLYLMISSFSDCLEDAGVVVVSKRYLNKVLEERKTETQILNYSDTQYIEAENLINLYN